MSSFRRIREAEKPARARRVEARVSDGTRERLISTAERLFAEQGLSVSNRQIGEAAGEANNSVVGYHFGTKTELVLAILRSHAPDMEERRAAMLGSLSSEPKLGDWLACVVRPITDHLDSLGAPSWYARFLAQVATDPALRQVILDETLSSPSMLVTAEGLNRARPVLPLEVFEERSDMMRHIIIYTCAERERALQASLPTPRATWEEAALGMIDALIGLWSAPVHRPGEARKPCTTSAPRGRREER